MDCVLVDKLLVASDAQLLASEGQSRQNSEAGMILLSRGADLRLLGLLNGVMVSLGGRFLFLLSVGLLGVHTSGLNNDQDSHLWPFRTGLLRLFPRLELECVEINVVR